MDKNPDSKPINIGGYGSDRCEIINLTRQEVEVIEGSIRGGHNWIRRGQDGRLEKSPSYNPLPDPIEDEAMLPFWRRWSGDVATQTELFPHSTNTPYGFPSITIQSLCGYYYTPENYRQQASKLESFGFVCLRSRRGDDGRYDEAWYLPGLYQAKGDLYDTVKEIKNEKKQLEKAVSFLCANVSFGTLDTSTQRAAMVVD